MVEGNRLLSGRTLKRCTAGSNPALSAAVLLDLASPSCQAWAPNGTIAQLDRAPAYEAGCRRFESSWFRYETAKTAAPDTRRPARGLSDSPRSNCGGLVL